VGELVEELLELVIVCDTLAGSFQVGIAYVFLPLSAGFVDG